MIVLRKKRILLVLACVVLSICFINIGQNLKNKVALPTVSLPVSNKVIVLDAGHGSPDERGSLLKSEKVAYIRYLKK